VSAVREGDLVEVVRGDTRVIDRVEPAASGRLMVPIMLGEPYVDGLVTNGWTVEVLESAPPTDFGTVLSFGNAAGEWWTYVCTADGRLVPLAPTVEEDIKGRNLRLSYVLETRGSKVRVISRPVSPLIAEVLDEVRKRAIAEGSDSVTVRRLVLDNIADDLGAAS
jgi:hypothetical protein